MEWRMSWTYLDEKTGVGEVGLLDDLLHYGLLDGSGIGSHDCGVFCGVGEKAGRWW